MSRASMKCSLLCVVAAVFLAAAGSAQAAWSLVDNFGTETPNITISGQVAPTGQTWCTYSFVAGNGTFNVIANPTGIGTTKVLSLTNSVLNANVNAYLPLSIPANTPNATLFFQIYGVGASTTQGAAGGMTYNTPGAPSAYAGYVLQELATGVAGDPVFGCRNGASFQVMLSGSTNPPVAANTWYDVWMVFHTGATTGSYDVYIGDVNGNIKASATNLAYRTQSGPLAYLSLASFAEVSDGTLSTTYFTNIYLDPSADNHLTSPIATPAYVSLNLSGAFNEDAIIGPVVASQAAAHSNSPREWLGNEPQGLAPLSWEGWNGFMGNYVQALICDTSSNDGLTYPAYTYPSLATYTGTQGLPENGIINSLADSRSYMIASVSGNALLAGDWADPAYNQSKSGTVISGTGTSAVIYGTTTYTGSNPIHNTLVVGQYNNASMYSPSWVCTSLTANFTPGYYTDINFAMKAGTYANYNGAPYYGASGAQIWANYLTGSSQLLYNFSQGEMTPSNSHAANFNLLYTCGDSAYAFPALTATKVNGSPCLLYEFSSPKTLDSTRQLTSITFSYNPANGLSMAQLAVFGATAKTLSSGGDGSFTGSEVVTGMGGIGGSVSVSNSGPYSDGQQFTATATPSTGWVLAAWFITGPSTLSSSTATTPTITVHGNFTLTAFFRQQTVQMDLSNAFNFSNWVGPRMYDNCVAQHKQAGTLYHDNINDLIDSLVWGKLLIADDPSPLTSYNGANYSGAQGTPSNGVLTGADRTYYIASVGGNPLLPGDWTETSNSGLMMNTIVVGQSSWIWWVSSVTVSTLPYHYSDVNFVLAAGGPCGANGIQIIANYNDSSSTVLYDFGTYTGTYTFVGPNQGSSLVVTGFRNVYTTACDYNEGTGSAGAVESSPLYLWEFSSPLALNSSKVLTSLTFLNYSTSSRAWTALAIYGATANVAQTSGSLNLTTVVSPAGAGTITPPSEPVPCNFTLPVAATATNSNTYVFDHWTLSDANAVLGAPYPVNPSMTISLTTSMADFLTVNNSDCTLTACFRSATGYTDTLVNVYNGGTITTNPNPTYSYGQVVAVTASAKSGWRFTNWVGQLATVTNATSSSTSITVYDSFTLTASYVEIPYTVTVSTLPMEDAGGIYWENPFVYYDTYEDPYVYVTNSAVTIYAVPQPGWSFVAWTTITGANLTGGNVATSTMSVFSNVFLTASFTQNKYAVTVQQPGGGTISLAPSQSTYTYGTSITITAAPTGGNTFANWVLTGSGQIASYTSSQTTLTVQGSTTLTALWGTAATLTVTPANGLGWTVSPAGPYSFGQVVTVTATSLNAGYVLKDWKISGQGYFLSNSGALAVSLMMDGNTTLSADYTTGSYVNNLSPAASDSNPGSLQAPFKTIGKTTGLVMPGTTVVIQQGVYRESPTFVTTGSAGNPITLRSNPGDRVVINGADVIPQGANSWTLCTSTTASGNPNYASMYYTDVTWSGCAYDSTPYRLSEDELNLQLAQTPSNGPPSYWPLTGGGTGTLTDSVHLTQTDSTYWLGANVFYCTGLSQFAYYSLNGGSAPYVKLNVTGYNPATSTITYGTSQLPASFTTAPWLQNQYFLYGSPKLISGPGQWAVETQSASSYQYRIWVWPTSGGRPDGHLYQASRAGGGLNLSYWQLSPGYYIVDGLELCNSNGEGVYAAGTNNGNSFVGGGNHIVRNCVVHDNDWSGIEGNYNLNGLYAHNLSTHNGLSQCHLFGGEGGCGFCTNGWQTIPMNETWLENESGWNGCDGFYLATCSLNIIGNYIHNNGQNGHCDGIQLCMNYGNSTTIVNNLFDGNSDFLQSNWSTGILIHNNVMLCTIGWGIQSNTIDTVWDHNTFVGLGAPAEGQDGPLTMTNNLFDFTQVGSLWSVDTTLPYYSDYNLIYQAPTYGMSNIGGMYYGTGNWVKWATYLQQSGLDTHTITGSLPLLNNMPLFDLIGRSPGSSNMPTCSNEPHYSASTLFIDGNLLNIMPAQVGDNIEINGDGVRRQITNIDFTNSFITFSPSNAALLMDVYTVHVFDWQNQTCTTRNMDIGLQPGSPALGAADDGTDIGANNFKIADYAAGKLNGASKRVLPIWPPAPVTLASTGWKYMNGGTTYALTEGGTYTNPNMTGFQLTLGAPLYALSCINNAAVTVVDNNGTTYPINAATLDSTGTVLTIVLTNGALPRNVSWIQVNVGPALMGANGTDPTVGTNGGPVTGVKSMRFTIN